MFSEAISGLNSAAGSTRSSMVMVAAPPVVMFTTTPTRSLIRPQERGEGGRALIGPPVARIARMEVDDRRPGLGGADGRVGDLFRRDREMRRHRGRVNRPCDRARDDDLPDRGHVASVPSTDRRAADDLEDRAKVDGILRATSPSRSTHVETPHAHGHRHGPRERPARSRRPSARRDHHRADGRSGPFRHLEHARRRDRRTEGARHRGPRPPDLDRLGQPAVRLLARGRAAATRRATRSRTSSQRSSATSSESARRSMRR